MASHIALMQKHNTKNKLLMILDFYLVYDDKTISSLSAKITFLIVICKFHNYDN